MWAGFQNSSDCEPSLTSMACQNYRDARLVKSRRAAWLYYETPIQVSGTRNQKWRIQSMKGMTGAPPLMLYLDLSCCTYGVHMYFFTYFSSFLFAVEIKVAVCHSLTHIYPSKAQSKTLGAPLHSSQVIECVISICRRVALRGEREAEQRDEQGGGEGRRGNKR